ncbi:hypothetical protein GOV13_01810 [Candidatus Pacearchaeota archaeon]|nr:hypothetical protein [Candidatus Pacearchaeota archaeon]
MRKINRRAQGRKSKISFAIKNKSGQEEMIGFTMIVIIVTVILLIFIGFSLRSPQKEAVESYEVESFIQSFKEYTTDCAEGYEPVYYSIRRLITACKNGEMCSDNRDTCEVLDTTIREILAESWPVGEDRLIKGYELKILSNDEEILLIQEGEMVGNSKGAVQYLKGIDILFTAYY